MNLCFAIICILFFLSSCNVFIKIMFGTLFCVLFNIILKNKIQTFGQIIFVACLIAINLVYKYILSDFLCTRNGIIIALLLNSIMSVYILCVLLLIEKIQFIIKCIKKV